MKYELEKLLEAVQKPGRYTGGEVNSVMKDKSKIDIRYAFCFPDTYVMVHNVLLNSVI